jgi:hypothetical protein
MNDAQIAATACVLLFFGMLLLTFAGYRLGRRQLERTDESWPTGVGPVEGAVFALLGLLTAFTFSGAYARLDARRQLIVQETNAIGTAYLLLDLLPGAAQPPLRERFLEYVDSRAAFFPKLNAADAGRMELNRAATLQSEIWAQVVTASTGEELQSARMLLFPALNEMIGITTTREVAANTHPPLLIFGLLFGLALACAVLTGHAMAKSTNLSLMHVVGFATVIAVTFYVILDMEYPRSGLIRLDTSNQLLLELRHQLERVGAARVARQ